jgi:pimeloyl-ACP methyl ester carboxylesterase
MDDFRDGRSQSPLSALWIEPPDDLTHPARTLPQAIPSCSANLNAVLYQASGPGPHPTALLLHGLPGNEQNLDCAQSLRRSGCNALTIHYRGSWGSPGVFTIANCLSDAAAALEWLRDGANGGELRIDRQRLIVVGHSTGGFVAAHLASENLGILGAAVISAVDFETVFGAGDAERASEIVDDNVGFSAGLHILAGTSREKLAAEARCNALRWSLPSYASRLAGRPLLIATADDGFSPGGDLFADAVLAFNGGNLTRVHFATDHSYSTCRIELQSRLLLWLDKALGRPSARAKGSPDLIDMNQG